MTYYQFMDPGTKGFGSCVPHPSLLMPVTITTKNRKFSSNFLMARWLLSLLFGLREHILQ